jgi:hypothetical protein
MRKAQAEYENCADEYQLRIKTLNKVTISHGNKMIHSDKAVTNKSFKVVIIHTKKYFCEI